MKQCKNFIFEAADAVVLPSFKRDRAASVSTPEVIKSLLGKLLSEIPRDKRYYEWLMSRDIIFNCDLKLKVYIQVR